MTPAGLNWSGAEVKDSKLAVELEGELPKGWKQSFERTVALLGGGDWGEIQFKKRTVHVDQVSPGSEENLRHFLESVVAQANADFPLDEDDGEPQGTGQDAEQDDDGTDTEMRERFRSFGERN